jgi:hypothetical protein
VYASLEGLRDILGAKLDSDDMRVLFEHHRQRIARTIGGAGLSPTETALAGFLAGFLTAAMRLADDAEVMADSIDPFLGGICLYADETLGQHAAITDGVEYLDRLGDTLHRDPEYRDLTQQQRADAVALVIDVFKKIDDVPVNTTSLAGFALGVGYAAPFRTGPAGPESAALLGAALTLARRTQD